METVLLGEKNPMGDDADPPVPLDDRYVGAAPILYQTRRLNGVVSWRDCVGTRGHNIGESRFGQVASPRALERPQAAR